MHAILAGLGFGHSLEGQGRAACDRRLQHHVLLPLALDSDAQHGRPERGESVGIGAIDDNVGEVRRIRHEGSLLVGGGLDVHSNVHLTELSHPSLDP